MFNLNSTIIPALDYKVYFNYLTVTYTQTQQQDVITVDMALFSRSWRATMVRTKLQTWKLRTLQEKEDANSVHNNRILAHAHIYALRH